MRAVGSGHFLHEPPTKAYDLEHTAHNGPFEPGQSIWYWDRDASKLRDGEWIQSRIVSMDKPPMVIIDLKGQTARVN